MPTYKCTGCDLKDPCVLTFQGEGDPPDTCPISTLQNKCTWVNIEEEME